LKHDVPQIQRYSINNQYTGMHFFEYMLYDKYEETNYICTIHKFTKIQGLRRIRDNLVAFQYFSAQKIPIYIHRYLMKWHTLLLLIENWINEIIIHCFNTFLFQTRSKPSEDISNTSDPICTLTASDKMLVIARESGQIQRYALPNVALTNRYHINTKAHKLALNCTST